DPTKLETVAVSSGYSIIPNNSFMDLSKLTTVSFVEVVESIGSQAFAYCTSLVTFDIPNTVTELGRFAFYGCTKLEVVVLDSLITMRDRAFTNCTSLQNLSFLNLELMEERSFENCMNLETINLPNVTEIGIYTFRYCSSLTGIVFPKIEKIGDYAFVSCTSLREIEFTDTLTKIGQSSFLYGYLTSLTFYGNIEKIGIEAFFGQNNLTSVIFEGSVEEISASAFGSCPLLSTLVFSGDVELIGSEAFKNCPSLTSVIFPSSLQSIGWDGFRGCTSLSYIVINNKDLIFGVHSFSGGSSQLDVYLGYLEGEYTNNWGGWRTGSYTLYYSDQWHYQDSVPTLNQLGEQKIQVSLCQLKFLPLPLIRILFEGNGKSLVEPQSSFRLIQQKQMSSDIIKFSSLPKENFMKIRLILALISGLLILVLTSCVKRVTYTITWVNPQVKALQITSGVPSQFSQVTVQQIGEAVQTAVQVTLAVAETTFGVHPV
ncbi:MAG: hypothetical protein EZS28_044689, partial [Streblomastix strix]